MYLSLMVLFSLVRYAEIFFMLRDEFGFSRSSSVSYLLNSSKNLVPMVFLDRFFTFFKSLLRSGVAFLSFLEDDMCMGESLLFLDLFFLLAFLGLSPDSSCYDSVSELKFFLVTYFFILPDFGSKKAPATLLDLSVFFLILLSRISLPFFHLLLSLTRQVHLFLQELKQFIQ